LVVTVTATESTVVETALGVSTVVVTAESTGEVAVGSGEVVEVQAANVATKAKINNFFIFCFLMIFKLINNMVNII